MTAQSLQYALWFWLWSLLSLALMASAGCWLWAARRWQRGQELLAWSPRRMVPWGLLDVGFCFLLLILVDAAGLQLAGIPLETELTELEPAQQMRALLTMAGGRLAVTALALVILMGRTHASARDAGLAGAPLNRDLKIGACAFLMVAPVVYGLQQLLSMVWKETSHQLVALVRNDPQLFWAACATAVLTAPLMEEMLLRVVFQGWLEKAALWRGGSAPLMLGTAPEELPAEKDAWPPVKDPIVPLADRPPPWPILLSAALFALMHLNFSDPAPDPIPLFVFALALGFVYQRTHRLLPCVVMHVLLNAFSMAVLGLSVWQQ